MLSMTQFPRRFPTIRKRVLHHVLAANAKTAGLHRIPAQMPSNPLFTEASSTFSTWPMPLSGRDPARASFNTSAASAALNDVPPPETNRHHHHDDPLDLQQFHHLELTGPRGDEWFTTHRNPRDWSVPFPGRCDQTGKLHSIAMPSCGPKHQRGTRSQLLDYFDNTWALTDALFASLQGEQAFLTPPPHGLRHPLIFYYGHPTVFYVNKLVVAGLLPPEGVNRHFEEVFEVGVDEMRWDDMSKNTMQWPAVHEVLAYRKHVYALVRELIETHPDLADDSTAVIDANHPLWAFYMGLEHERIHLETSSVLMQEQPVHFFKPDELLPSYHPSSARTKKSNGPNSFQKPRPGMEYPENPMIAKSGGVVMLGKPHDYPSFGWDNEYGTRQLQVPPFKASKFMVSNGEFWQFVHDGGYLEPKYWSPHGWQWRCFRNTKWPAFWQADGPEGSHQYKLRALFSVIDMQWDWPVQVNYHEAQAFCRWKTFKQQQQQEDAVGGPDDGKIHEVYHLTTEPIHQLIRRPQDLSVDAGLQDDIMTFTSSSSGSPPPRRMADATGKNLNFSYLSFSPVDEMTKGKHAVAEDEFCDVFGNAWEWCEDQFAPLSGFDTHPFYEDFSAPCFDGEHNVIMGGSFISSGDNGGSKFARYHFRPHFFQHAGFRLVSQQVDPTTDGIALVTSCVNAPGPYAKPKPYRVSEFMTRAQVLSQVHHQSSRDVSAQFLEQVDQLATEAQANLVESLGQQFRATSDQIVLFDHASDLLAALHNKQPHSDQSKVFVVAHPALTADDRDRLGAKCELVHETRLPRCERHDGEDGASKMVIDMVPVTVWKMK